MGADKDEREANEAARLRRQAEERLHAKSAEPHPPLSGEEARRLVHELEVRQIELETENAMLRLARDEAETALERYVDLYDFAPIGYFILDRYGVISAVNLSGAGLLGVERSRLIGRRFGLFVALGARAAFYSFLAKVFASPVKAACELALLKERPRPLFVQVEAVATASGRECRAAIIDISARRELEENLEHLHSELAARTADLESANIELEAFNYSVSHDLRRPLTNINGYCQLVEELCGNKLDGQCRSYIREMYDGTLRMNRLIDTLLDFSRITRVEMGCDKVDLSEIAKEVARGLKDTEPERAVTLRIAEGVLVEGDADLLRVVLDNLMGNAWKYTGGREGVVIEFGVAEIDGTPACFVRDNGPGFDMEHAGKLFIPFQCLPGDEKFRGHGIGLAMAERIIRRHGGRIWAEGVPGKGATFYFTI